MESPESLEDEEDGTVGWWANVEGMNEEAMALVGSTTGARVSGGGGRAMSAGGGAHENSESLEVSGSSGAAFEGALGG